MTTKQIIITLFILLPLFASGQNAIIKGRVVDQSTNEPVSFANILVMNTDIGSTSDLDGNFILTGLKPGYIQLRASFIGYEAQITRDILVSNANTAFLQISLKKSSTQLSEVTIKVDPFQKRDDAPVSLQRIGIREIESNPGSNRDISRVIQSFPGIGSTPAFRNDIIVRGGGPSENRFYLDDVEIPVLNHFSTQGASGGPVGIINADLIGSVNYFASAFPAERFNALSGVFEFTQIDGNPDKLKFRGSLGASEVSATVDGPIGEKTSYIFSARRSYLQLLFGAIGLPFLPTFNDYQLKVKTRLNAKNEISIISIGSYDQLTLNEDIENPDASQEYILTQIPVNNQWSYTFGIVFKHFMENGYQTIVASRNMLDNQFYKYPDNDESRPRSFDYASQEAENKLRYEVDQVINGYKVSYGLSTEYSKYVNETYQQLYYNNELNNVEYQSDLDLFKMGAFAQLSKRYTNIRTLFSLGIRVDGNTFSSNMSNPLDQFSPRFSVSHALTGNTNLNGSIGRFYQLPAYTTLGYRNMDGQLINKNAKYIGVNHMVAGLEYKPKQSLLFSVEGFYKDYFQYPISLINGISLANGGASYSSVAGAEPVVFSGSGKAVGFEVLNRVNVPGFNLIASYTFVRSLFDDINGKEIASAWDSRHLLTLTGTKDFKKNWSAGFKWRFVGGLPYTPYNLDQSALVEVWDATGQASYDYTQLNTLRFKSFHQLDIRIDKKYFFDTWNLMFYADIQNAYNFQNKGQDYIIRQKNSDGSFATTDGGTKYVLNRIENMGGTLLPSIGIMIEF